MSTATPALTEEQVASFRRNGYLTVPSVYPLDMIEGARAAVAEFVERSRDLTESDEVFDLESGHTAAAPRLRRIKNPARDHPVFRELLHHQPMIDIVAAVFGTGVRYQTSKLNMKDAAFGSPVQWHQDWSFYPHTNDNLLAVGIYLDDTTAENGAMRMVPGSHTGPVYSHHQDGVFAGACNPADIQHLLDKAVSVEVEAGGISMHHVRVLHGSASNTSKRPRRLLIFQMTAIDAWPLSGVPDFEEFNSQILLGEPTHEFRMERLPVLIAEPKPDVRGSIYDIQTILHGDREVWSHPT